LFDGIAHALPRILDLELRFAGDGGSRNGASTYAFTVPNLDEPPFDEPREHEEFHALRTRLGRHAGGERLGERPPTQ
jgi:hypothetical protein